MRRLWALVALGFGLALAACWDFEGAYRDCVDTGRCASDGGGDAGNGSDAGGGSDGGDAGGSACPVGAPSGNGLCLVSRYSTIADMYGLFGTSSSSIFTGGSEDWFAQVQGGALNEQNTGTGNHVRLTDLFGLSDSDVWGAGAIGFVGHSYVYHWDGAGWTDEMPSSVSVDDCNGVWAEDAGYAFAACDLGLMRVTTAGSSQTLLDGNTTGVAYHGVWGVPNGPAWVVGYDGTTTEATVTLRTGGTWSTQTFPGVGVLRAVHGRSDHDVWAVGDTSALMHLDDAGWRTVSTGVTADFDDVFVAPSGQVWATAYDQRVLVIEPDGGQRAFIPPGLVGQPEYQILQRVHVFSSGDVWITASTDDGGSFLHGAILHYKQQ